MIVDKVWKLTNTVSVGVDPWSSHTHRQTTFPDECVFLLPPCHVVSYWKFDYCLFSWNFFFKPRGKCDEQTQTGEGGNDKRVRTTSDDGCSVVWDLYRLTCVGGSWTPPWLTWCGLNKHLRSSWKRWTKRTHTLHTESTLVRIYLFYNHSQPATHPKQIDPQITDHD